MSFKAEAAQGALVVVCDGAGTVVGHGADGILRVAYQLTARRRNAIAQAALRSLTTLCVGEV